MIEKLADTIEAGESMQSKQKRNKFKSKYLPPWFKFDIFADMEFFYFPNHILKLKARGNAGEESLLTCEII